MLRQRRGESEMPRRRASPRHRRTGAVQIVSVKLLSSRAGRKVAELLLDLHRVLESAGLATEADADEPVTERVAHAIENFEESHPTLTATLSRLAEALGRIAV